MINTRTIKWSQQSLRAIGLLWTLSFGVQSPAYGDEVIARTRDNCEKRVLGVIDGGRSYSRFDSGILQVIGEAVENGQIQADDRSVVLQNFSLGRFNLLKNILVLESAAQVLSSEVGVGNFRLERMELDSRIKKWYRILNDAMKRKSVPGFVFSFNSGQQNQLTHDRNKLEELIRSSKKTLWTIRNKKDISGPYQVSNDSERQTLFHFLAYFYALRYQLTTGSGESIALPYIRFDKTEVGSSEPATREKPWFNDLGGPLDPWEPVNGFGARTGKDAQTSGSNILSFPRRDSTIPTTTIIIKTAWMLRYSSQPLSREELRVLDSAVEYFIPNDHN
jgi:hypothetical protein